MRNYSIRHVFTSIQLLYFHLQIFLLFLPRCFQSRLQHFCDMWERANLYSASLKASLKFQMSVTEKKKAPAIKRHWHTQDSDLTLSLIQQISSRRLSKTSVQKSLWSISPFVTMFSKFVSKQIIKTVKCRKQPLLYLEKIVPLSKSQLELICV